MTLQVKDKFFLKQQLSCVARRGNQNKAVSLWD